MGFVPEITAFLENPSGRLARICWALAVEIDDRPGALARILERLAEDHINVESAYLAASPAPGRSVGILHAANPRRTQQLLAEPTGAEAGQSPRRRPLHSR